MNINQAQYPVGSRLLVAWMIKVERFETGITAWPAKAKERMWEENDQIGEVSVMEYSPSGTHVRLTSPGDDNRMHFTGGWYPIMRIVVKETLTPRQSMPPLAPVTPVQAQGEWK